MGGALRRSTIVTRLPLVVTVVALAACGQTPPEPFVSVATQPSSVATPEHIASAAALLDEELAAGDHQVELFDPGMRFRVPVGWSSLDLGNYFRFDLIGPSGPDAGVISLASGPFQAGSDPDCGSGAGLPSAGGVIERLTADQRFTTTRARPITLGGLSGQVVDVELDPDWRTVCPPSTCASMRAAPGCAAGAPGAALLVRPEGPHFPMLGVFGTERVRLILLDPGGVTCCSVAIAIHAPDADLFDAFLAESSPLLKSFEFGR